MLSLPEHELIRLQLQKTVRSGDDERREKRAEHLGACRRLRKLGASWGVPSCDR